MTMSLDHNIAGKRVGSMADSLQHGVSGTLSGTSVEDDIPALTSQFRNVVTVRAATMSDQLEVRTRVQRDA